MCIYFIQAEQGGLIKIGYSKNPTDRLYGLQLYCPIPLKILSVIKDASQAQEGYIHSDLFQWRQHGEWFEPSPEVIKFIEENGSELSEPDITDFDEEYIIVRGKQAKRCKGYSQYEHQRCKRPVAIVSGEEYCHIHKP